MSDGQRIECDSFKFGSWCLRRLAYAITGRKFGSLELDEQMGTATHAVYLSTASTPGYGLRIVSAAAGAAFRAISDIARSLNVADLEVTRTSGPHDSKPYPEHSDGNEVSHDAKEDT